MTLTFFDANLALESALYHLLSPTTELVIVLSHKIHFSLHVTIQSRNVSLLLCRIRENDTSMIFLIFSQLKRHPLIEIFHVSNLLQMPNDCRMVNVKFFHNFSCSCKKISFDDWLQLVVVNF